MLTIPHIVIVLGCLHVRSVDSQVDPVGPATPVVELGFVHQGPGDIGGDCVVNQPCNPGEYFGYYAHPTNCSKYFQCGSAGRITGDSCPPDKLWNNETRKCVDADEAVCQQGCPPGSSSRSNVISTTLAPEVYKISNNCEVLLPCDPGDNSTGGRYANPDNCQEFFICEGGTLSQDECLDNQHYDPSKGCTDQGNDVCLERDQCPRGSRMKQTNTMSSTTTTTTTTTSSPDVPEFTGPCDPPEVCTPGEKLYHPGNCRMYFECDDSNQWVEKQCPRYGFFIASERRCPTGNIFIIDCPTGCLVAPVNQTDQVTPSPDPNDSGTIPGVMNISVNCQVKLPCHTEIKPAYRFIPHPDNCSLYWFCDSSTGKPTLEECPKDTFFNSSNRNCDRLEENVQGYCQRGCPEYSEPIEITTTTITTTKASRPPPTIDPFACNRPSECRPRDRLADPEDCYKYYICFGRKYQRIPCSGGMFDAETKTCVPEKDATCHPPCTTSTSSSITTTASTSTMSLMSTTTTTGTSQTSTSNSSQLLITTTTEAQVPTLTPTSPRTTTTTSSTPTTTTTTTATITDSSGRNTTGSIPSNSSTSRMEHVDLTTTEKTSTTESQVTTKYSEPLLDPVDEDITDSPPNPQKELSTTPNPSETVTDKEPPVTSDGILLPSEFVSLTYGMNLSSSISTNFTIASLTQVVDSSSTASIMPSVSKIDPKFQSSQVVPTDDATNENNSNLMTTKTTVTFNSHSEVITETSSDQLSSSPFQTHSSLYDTTTLHPTYDSYSSVERVTTSAQYDMSTTDMVSSADLATSHSHTDDEKTNIVSDGTVSATEIMTSTDMKSSYISDYTRLNPNTLGHTPTTEDTTSTQSSDFATVDTTSIIMFSGSDHSYVETSSFISSTLSSTLGTDQTTGTISTGQFSSDMTSSETSTSETETSDYTELTYSSPKTTPELSTEQTVSESGGTTETTSLSASFTNSSTLFSPDYELTTSVPSSSSQLDGLDVTTELIISGSTVSEDMNAELTIATNIPMSTAASASVNSGGVLGNDHMTSPSDQDTSTPGVGPSVTGRCNCYAFYDYA